MKIIVTGGNGFIGSEICRMAVEENAEVFSISRKGPPENSSSWTKKVTWLKANIFETQSWFDVLQDGDALIHTIGILKEKPSRNITYERMNGESTIIAAKAAAAAKIPVFVMLSASDAPPLLNRYIRAKRIAENFLVTQPFRCVIMRPGFVYGPSRKGTAAIATLTKTVNFIPILGRFTKKYSPVHVSELASAVLYAVRDKSIHGIVNIDAIKQYSHRNFTMEDVS